MVVLIRSCCTIKPAKPTPSSGICIADCDQDKPITHAPVIYFYRPSSSTNLINSFPSTSTSIEAFKTSLSEALVYFYPLAGRLRWTGHGGRVELECNSKGAQLYESDSDRKLDHLGDFCPTPELRELIPPVDYAVPLHELPLLLVHLTRFRCGGISLCVAVSHIMADGSSVSHFMSVWAKIARGQPLDVFPFLDRTVLLAGNPLSQPRLFNHHRFIPPPLLIGQNGNEEEQSKETTVTMLHLSKTQVEKLKNMANISRAAGVRPYGRYEAVAAHLWRSTCRARGHRHDQITNLYFQVNFRTRMRPPLPQGYFGNAMLTTLAASRSGELMTKPLGHGSSKIREAVEMVNDEYVRSFLNLVKSQPDLTPWRTRHSVGSTQMLFRGNPNLEITSWLGIPLKNMDFGWGKEVHMGPATLAFDGKTFVLDGHDGSLVIALRLQVAHMDALKEFFYKGISDCKL